jgi:hypothetical protein
LVLCSISFLERYFPLPLVHLISLYLVSFLFCLSYFYHEGWRKYGKRFMLR